MFIYITLTVLCRFCQVFLSYPFLGLLFFKRGKQLLRLSLMLRQKLHLMPKLMLMHTMAIMVDMVMELLITLMDMLTAMLVQLSMAILHTDMDMDLVMDTVGTGMATGIPMDMDCMDTMVTMEREKLMLMLTLVIMDMVLLIPTPLPIHTHIPMDILLNMVTDKAMDMEMGLEYMDTLGTMAKEMLSLPQRLLLMRPLMLKQMPMLTMHIMGMVSGLLLILIAMLDTSDMVILLMVMDTV